MHPLWVHFLLVLNCNISIVYGIIYFICYKEVFMNSDIQTIITSVGFPIALSFYLLIRFEEKLQKLTDRINELSKNILSMR